MRSIARFTLIPQDATLTIAARGPLAAADTDRLAAVCVSLPVQIRRLVLDLRDAGLLGADALRRVSRAASSWRYARGATVLLQFRASAYDGSGAPTAVEVPVEVKFAPRRSAARARVVPMPRLANSSRQLVVGG